MACKTAHREFKTESVTGQLCITEQFDGISVVARHAEISLPAFLRRHYEAGQISAPADHENDINAISKYRAPQQQVNVEHEVIA
jgi:hypothetical protein